MVQSLMTTPKKNPFSELDAQNSSFKTVTESKKYKELKDKSSAELTDNELNRYNANVDASYNMLKNALDNTDGGLPTAMNTPEHIIKTGDIFDSSNKQAIKQGFNKARDVINSAIGNNSNINVAGNNLTSGTYTTEGTYGNANNRSYLDTLTAQRLVDRLNNKLWYNPGGAENFATYSPLDKPLVTEETRQMDTIRARKQALDNGIIDLQTGALSREWLLKKGLDDEQIKFFNTVAHHIGLENAARLVSLYIDEYVGKAYGRYATNLDNILSTKTSQHTNAEAIRNLSKLSNTAIKEVLAKSLGMVLPNFIVDSALGAMAPLIDAAETVEEKNNVIITASRKLAEKIGVNVQDLIGTMFSSIIGFAPPAVGM